MIERLTELCADSTTAGHLTAEGCRLLCVLVKYSQNAGIWICTDVPYREEGKFGDDINLPGFFPAKIYA